MSQAAALLEASPPAPREMPRLGPYQTFRRLAAGGMGEIFLAFVRGPSGFEKLVVVKRILPHFASDRSFVEMFLNEARIAGTLSHPNIVQVFDAGRADDGSYYFAMEYLHGADLGQILRAAAARKEAVPLEHVVTITMAAAAGLHHAHEKRGPEGKPLRIIHRDVSPANVMVTDEGSIKILDFGIAKALAATAITREGTRKGKAAYMSPEQCLGGPLDRRSDIFALGILLYEASVMRRLFRADNEFATMNMITSGQIPRPTSARPDYPPALEQIVLKALARDPAERHATALDLHDDLDRFAVANHLRTSATAAGRYVHDIFGDRPLPTPESADDPTAPVPSHDDLPLVTMIDDVLATRVGVQASPLAVSTTRPRPQPWLSIGGAVVALLALVVALMRPGRNEPVVPAVLVAPDPVPTQPLTPPIAVPVYAPVEMPSEPVTPATTAAPVAAPPPAATQPKKSTVKKKATAIAPKRGLDGLLPSSSKK